jgi:hypothetical protein
VGGWCGYLERNVVFSSKSRWAMKQRRREETINNIDISDDSTMPVHKEEEAQRRDEMCLLLPGCCATPGLPTAGCC